MFGRLAHICKDQMFIFLVIIIILNNQFQRILRPTTFYPRPTTFYPRRFTHDPRIFIHDPRLFTHDSQSNSADRRLKYIDRLDRLDIDLQNKMAIGRHFRSLVIFSLFYMLLSKFCLSKTKLLNKVTFYVSEGVIQSPKYDHGKLNSATRSRLPPPVCNSTKLV